MNTLAATPSASSSVAAAALRASRLGKHAQRKRVNAIALLLSLTAMAFGLFWLIWILFETVRLGIGGLSLSLFTQMTPPPQDENGGLANAIFGSVTMVTLATALGTPIGVLPASTWPNTARRAGSAASRASSTTSCWPRRRSSSACSSTRWWWRA